MQPNLTFEQAPPISVPFRFFLAAPWFGVAAGLWLVWSGAPAASSRWSAGALALTHLMVLGFMLQAMTGALFQFVPVAAGGNVWRPRLVAGIVQPLLLVGTALLVAGFESGVAILFRLAAGVILLAVALLVAVIGVALQRTPAAGATVRALRLAVAGLAITVTIGAALAEGFAVNHGWPLIKMADVHAGWGLGGWALVLLAGVSYFVVPMFQLTPPFPDRFARLLPLALAGAASAWSLQLLGAGAGLLALVWYFGLSLAAAYATVLLVLQVRRRRRVTDPTFWFFRGAAICLLAIWLSAVVFALMPALGEHPRAAWWLGVLIISGTFVSAINGMLYKIVPFLVWLHLQRLTAPGTMPPTMRAMISESAASRQMQLHFLAVAVLLAAAIWPAAAGIGGLLFSLSCAWLAWNLVSAVRVYVEFRDRIVAADPGRER